MTQIYTSSTVVRDGEMTLENGKELLEFDSDFNGENGLEYTSQEAQDNGYESDLELVYENTNNYVDFISEFIVNYGGTYSDYSLSTIKIEEGVLVVTLALAVE